MKFFSKQMLQKWSFASEFATKGGKNVSDSRPSPTSQTSSLPQNGFNEVSGRCETTPNSANFIQIGLASSDEIQNWAERSYFIGEQFVEIGEVKRPDTLNYRTFKPEKDGLFCERIFGPVNDWTCACGQIKEQRFALDHEKALVGKLKPKVCANCQVEVTSSRLRRYRMGYISLACPVTHIWYLNSRPSLFSILLKMPTKYIKKIAYYKAYSPSSLQREYISSCLGPGGDFFDNEWEFLHLWLSGKHSVEDIPSQRTQFLQSGVVGGTQEPYRPSTQVSQSVLSRATPAAYQQQLPQQNAQSEQSGITDTKGNPRFAPKLIEHSSPIIEIVTKQSASGKNVGLSSWNVRNNTESAWVANERIPGTVGRLVSSLYEEHIVLAGGSDFTGLFGKSDTIDNATRSSLRSAALRWDPQSLNTAPLKSGNSKLLRALCARSANKYAKRHDTSHFAQGRATTIKKTRKQMQSVSTGTDWEGTQSGATTQDSSTSFARSAREMDYHKMPESPEWLANTGAQALLNLLKSRNWQKEAEKLEYELQATPSLNDELACASRDFTGTLTEKETDFLLKRRKARVRTLKLLKSFQKSGLPFTGMIFHSFPVLPPELRPIIQLGAGQLASSDVNDLYRRILSRNNRLKYYLYETHFVEFLVRSEQQLVQLAVDALLENGKTTSVRHTSGQKRLYKSLSDRIGGKQGRFRMNLLGKRVDYSGRSVIVVGPRLKLFQCGLPYEMAIELFQPFLLRHMLELQLAKTIRAAKNILRFNKPLARQLLHHIVQAHPILLNRAPTLHRLGIQAFQPVLVFGRAIHLHPLVCPAFNADFDGDQMAVHIPLSPQARIEARLLMLASGNWLSASTGQPNVLPSQDMVLGFYYLTIEKYAYQKGRGLFFNSLTDVLQAYELGSIDLHSQIWLKWYGPFTGDSTTRLTTPKKHQKMPLGGTGACATQPYLFAPRSASTPLRSSSGHLSNIYRFKRDTDQPIEIRINKNGISTKIYSSYQWQQDSFEKHRVSYIRTTPGRVLINDIFQKFSN